MNVPIGLNALFPKVTPASFMNLYFPSKLLVHHGSIARLGMLSDEPVLCKPDAFLDMVGESGKDVIVRDVTTIPAVSPMMWVQVLQRELSLTDGQVGCHVIYTPKGKGTGRHFDGIEGITIQLCGRKLWRFEPHAELPIPNRVGVDPSLKRMRTDARRFTLRPGSSSFLPRGWWHDTIALETAISLHFELRVDTWIGLILRFVREKCLSVQQWRAPIQRVNGIPSDSTAHEQWLALRADLIDSLRVTQVNDLFDIYNQPSKLECRMTKKQNNS